MRWQDANPRRSRPLRGYSGDLIQSAAGREIEAANEHGMEDWFDEKQFRFDALD
jgi:hypothetical protein